MTRAYLGKTQRSLRLSRQEVEADPSTEKRGGYGFEKSWEGKGKVKRESRRKGRGQASLPSDARVNPLPGPLLHSRPLNYPAAAADNDAAFHLPGSLAPSSSVPAIWNSLFRWITTRPSSNFACFCVSLLKLHASTEGATASTTWPMPPPYPESFDASIPCGAGSFVKNAQKKAINQAVIALSWLHLGKPKTAPKCMAPGTPLSLNQKSATHRMERFFQEIKEVKIGPAQMGRTAAKMEGLNKLVAELHKEAISVLGSGYGSYLHSNGQLAQEPAKPGHALVEPGKVVGAVSYGAPVLAKDADAERLSFPKDLPSFDPTSLFSEPHRQVYQDPVSLARDPAQASTPPPVRVQANHQKALEFLHFLDQHGRLALAPEAEVRKSHLCGAFSLVKDESADRLILDARPANDLEKTLSEWVKTLGSIQALLQLELKDGHHLRFSGTDLKDYYYCFRVSPKRARRNALKFPLSLAQAQRFQCFNQIKDKLDSQTRVFFPCLSTMAMGDNNAVELGQRSHIEIGIASGVFHPSELLSIHGRAPRGDLACGVIIDDVLFTEQVPAADLYKQPLQSSRRLEVLCEEYLQRGLTAHPKKTFKEESKADIWGASIDGDTGIIRPAARRLVPLLGLTSRIARLGFASVGLLEVLCGSWVSILQFRRRMLCLIDALYVAQGGRKSEEMV